MYIIECGNCNEANQVHDKMEGKTIRCHICQSVIQVKDIPKAVIKNINALEDHEERIIDIEKAPTPAPQPPLPPSYIYPFYYIQPHIHPFNCKCNYCSCGRIGAVLFTIAFVVFIVLILIC